MSANAEAIVIAHLNADPALPSAYPDAPAERPDRFITVDRVGGRRSNRTDNPLLAIQCWDKSRFDASTLALDVVASLDRLLAHDSVGAVEVTNTYNFPDPESGQARYQVVAELIVAG